MKKIFPLALIFFLIFTESVLAKANRRFISLAPATTEILFSLGLDDQIIAVSSTCDYPKEVETKEKIGTFSQPNIEKILFLKPEIIFCSGLEQAPTINKLKQLGLKVYVSAPSNINELFESIVEIGKLTDREKEAKELIMRIDAKIDKVRSKVNSLKNEKKPKVFIEIWYSPLMTAGKHSYLDELLTLAGGINIAGDTIRPYSYFSPELVIKRNPDCIILTYMSNQLAGQAVKKRLGWQNISAVKNNRIFNDIDPNLLLRPGPRIAEGLNQLRLRLYSD